MDQTTDTQDTSQPATSAADKPFPVAGAGAAPQSRTSAPDTATKPSGTDDADPAAPAVDSLLKRMTQRAHDAVDGVSERISSAVDGLQGGVDRAGASRDEWIASARDAIRQHPFAAIGTAVLVGLALRSLASSRDR